MTQDDLAGEDLRQHRRVRQLRFGAVVTVVTLVLLALLASTTGVMAVRADAALSETGRQERVAGQQQEKAKESALEAARQQENARQQQGNATRSAQEAARQQENARQEQQRAQDAAADAQRQTDLAQGQKALADRAAAEAARQQAYAQQQQELADQAAAEAKRQQDNANRLADEAQKQAAKAEEQRRIAISRRLFNQAGTMIDTNPRTAMMLGVAARTVEPGAEGSRQLTSIVASMRYAGTINGLVGGTFGADDIMVAADADDRKVSLWRMTAVAVRFSPDGHTLLVSSDPGLAQMGDIAAPPTSPRCTATSSGPS